MLSTTDKHAPRVVVLGITGAQGGSVATALLDSEKPYRIVGLTRDTTKDSAKKLSDKGVEMVSIDLAAASQEEIDRAFAGADIVFAVTASLALPGKEAEVSLGKSLVNAAKTVGVKLFVFSSLAHVSKISGGRYTKVGPFDAKGEIAEYLRESGMPHALVSAGYYISNLYDPPAAPVKQPDGSFVLTGPFAPRTQIPLLDPQNDYGPAVRAIIENPALGSGSELLTGTTTSFQEIAEVLTEVTGKRHVYQQDSHEDFVVGKGMPSPCAELLWEAWSFVNDFGYYNGRKPEESLKVAGITPSPIRDMFRRVPQGKFAV
ncbi:hypothetical protein HDU86_005196 [Geranomyces michiganensis]|nr:hypothetical protein HDU86_005196 [Geranomyces michiganensis]